MKNILCLDFDGVICNSIDECLLIAYNSYKKLEEQNAEQVLYHTEIPADITNRFTKYRFLVRPAKDYFVLMAMVLQNENNLGTTVFEAIKRSLNNKLKAFEDIFFTTRSYYQQNHSEYWLSINKFYDDFNSVWSSLKEKYEIYIVTNKNREAVTTLLKANSIDVPNDRIYANDSKNTKVQVLDLIMQQYNANKDQIFFVDDSPETIKEALVHFPNSYLANWGYYENKEGIKSINSLAELL